MNKYGPGAQQEITKTMRAFKQGKLHSGKHGPTVTNRDQAVAIGISKAKRKSFKTPHARTNNS